MKVVHFAQRAPHQCGLYHTAKDLIKAEKGLGIDAHFVDVQVVDEKITTGSVQVDGKLTTSDVSVANDADILVRHTAIPNNLENCGIPIVMAVHGRPESSMLLGHRRKSPIIEVIYNKGRDARYAAFITFWKEHLDFWKLIIPPEKLFYVPAMVDLMDWRPDGKPFDFGEFNGNPNILIADIWREDVTPFNEVMAVRDFIKNFCPEARLHIIAAPTDKGANIFYRALRAEGVLGYVAGQTSKIKDFYAAADVVVTPHTIATRVIREAHACGVPVVAGDMLAVWWAEYQKSPQEARDRSRKVAEYHFNIAQSGRAIKKIFDGILNKKPKRRKVFLDLGGHLGETVRRFYREVEDARLYEIHTFEPHPDCYKKLCKATGQLKNVTTWADAITTVDGAIGLFAGTVNEGEGSTLLVGKKTGNIDYEHRYGVSSLSLESWAREQRWSENDYIVLKMNIEGGEYQLMRYLLDANKVVDFNQIYIQTHAHKLDPKEHNGYRALEQDFRKACLVANVDLFMQDKGMVRFQCEGGAI